MWFLFVLVVTAVDVTSSVVAVVATGDVVQTSWDQDPLHPY